MLPVIVFWQIVKLWGVSAGARSLQRFSTPAATGGSARALSDSAVAQSMSADRSGLQ